VIRHGVEDSSPLVRVGFELQHTKDDKIVTEVLPFDTVKSGKVIGRGMHFATKG
jgi:hypothetical protein